MKEYDIFLKRRLHEAEIIVYSLPYHDGVSATHKVVLQAIVTYFEMQKIFAVANQSMLVSDIDRIISVAKEMIDSEVCIDGDVDLLINYHNEQLEESGVVVDSAPLLMLSRSLMALESQFGIYVSNPETYTTLRLGNGDSLISILSEISNTQKQSFEMILDRIEMVGQVLDSHKHGFENVDAGFMLSQSTPSLCYQYAIGMESAFSIAVELNKLEVHYTLGNGFNEIEIGVSSVDSFIEKIAAIQNAISLFCDVASNIIKMFSVNNDAALQAELSAGMKRRRMLFEIDDNTLGDMDDKTLGELDYVILA